MKLNLEIDLDWIDEEKGLDETVKEEVIAGVVGKIQSQIEKKIETKVNQVIDTTIVEKISQKTDELFTDFINRPVTLTDGYGSKMKVYDNMEMLIKERFDNFMVQPVDEKGNSTAWDSYGTKTKRIEFIISTQLKKFADEFTKDAVKKVSEEIKLHVADGLQAKLGSELMKVLKVDKMLELPAKK